MHDISNLTVADLGALSRAIAHAGQAASSMEECGNRIVRYFYENLETEGQRACALVRFFKTHSLGDLGELQAVAKESLPAGVAASAGMKCLTLLATAGREPAWNSRHESRGHRVIPLPSVRMVEQFPMISQLIRQLGFQTSAIVEPTEAVANQLQSQNPNVFFVEDAQGSPYIPAQREFVEPYGIRSVVGFGSVLPSGNLFVIVLFTTAHIQRPRAEQLKVLAVAVKAAVLRFDYGTVFSQA